MAPLGMSGAGGNGLLWADVVPDNVIGLVASNSAVSNKFLTQMTHIQLYC
jgi:hypothetical protein